MTNGRGLIVSRFPRGICKTRLIELGTATTILDPLSTFRVSQLEGSSFGTPSCCSKTCGRVFTGAKIASCALVVKMTNPDAIANEVVFDESSRVSPSDWEAYSLPDFARPIYKTTSESSFLASTLWMWTQNSENAATGETISSACVSI